LKKKKMNLTGNQSVPEKKNGAAAANHPAANDEAITIVVNTEHYQIEIEIY